MMCLHWRKRASKDKRMLSETTVAYNHKSSVYIYIQHIKPLLQCVSVCV